MNKKIIKSTAHGSVGIIWTKARRKPRIIRTMITIPGLPAGKRAAELFPDAQSASCAEIDALASDIAKLLRGEPVDFSLDLVALNLCGEFQKRVLLANYRIPRGKVSTYGLIAAHLGKPGGARAVGNIMAGNPFPVIVPCHRVVRSDGSLGGFGGGSEMKRSMLEKESVRFDRAGKVPRDLFCYDA